MDQVYRKYLRRAWGKEEFQVTEIMSMLSLKIMTTTYNVEKPRRRFKNSLN